MTTITAEQKAEWQEASDLADAAIARLNAVYAATGRAYRVRRHHYKLDLFPDLDDDQDSDLAELAPVDGYRPTYRPGGERTERTGSERAEREDEREGADQDDGADESEEI